jgi:hypothetical protein
MDVYVVLSMGTPVAVEWTVMDANKLIDDMQVFSKLGRESFEIVSLPIQPVHEWLINAMSRAAVVAKSKGEIPVVVPDMYSSFLFAISEVGEASDALVHETESWKRSNPQNKVGLDFEKEASQAIMMLALATRMEFFENIWAQLRKWGFTDDPRE